MQRRHIGRGSSGSSERQLRSLSTVVIATLPPSRWSVAGRIRRLLASRSGATAIEYAFIAAFVSIAIVLGATQIGTKLSATFNNLAGNLS